MSMGFDSIAFAIIGFSASFIFCVSNLKRWQKQQITEEKLSHISKALENAEERVLRFQERHDRILSQVCSFYLANKELVEALEGARAAMNEAMEFAANLRRMQTNIIINYPDEVDAIMLYRSNEDSGRRPASQGPT
ncbi:hypothetical protein I3843_07G020200 [Carya illinoinensis]|uniref:Uncharacterized protein n=1 Tax=Carya illinoinensis TaxID=32201 RepID=A0A922EHJ1_CARIL|nr:hypothetical protein I3842_07G021200 [Carya illinoinensis]KAG7969240.1 hypothetical protein I3843_07G020200 [Carya illinoinensis]